GCLEAFETAAHAADRGVVEAEVTRAGRDGQDFRDDVEVEGGEEGGLLRLTHRVLVEGRIVALDSRILYRGPWRGADVEEAVCVVRGRARRHGLVVPTGLVPQLVGFPEHAADGAQPPVIRRAEAEFVLLVGVALVLEPG